MASDLKSCILRVVESFLSSNFTLTTQQYQAVENFVSSNNTFVSLPTGHGKSLIYQVVIPVVKELARHGWEKFQQHKLIVLVVAPLQALITDQIPLVTKRDCRVLGSRKWETNVVKISLQAPETMEKNMELLLALQQRIVGVVVDESHCVVNW